MSVRARKVEDLLKREISDILFRELKDPRIGFVTISRVRISDDLRMAKVYFSVLPQHGNPVETRDVLNHAANFFRGELKPRLRLRHIPVVEFFIDDSLDYVEKIERLIKKTKEKDQTD